MYSIDNIAMTNWGLYVSAHQGNMPLPDHKEQFFTAYGEEGFQITTRKNNTLDLKGFIVATDTADLINKTDQLFAALVAPSTRKIILGDATKAITCFNKDGFTISNVRVFSNAVYALINLKMAIISVDAVVPEPRVFTDVFNSVFGNSPIVEPPSSGIFNPVFSTQFN